MSDKRVAASMRWFSLLIVMLMLWPILAGCAAPTAAPQPAPTQAPAAPQPAPTQAPAAPQPAPTKAPTAAPQPAPTQAPAVPTAAPAAKVKVLKMARQNEPFSPFIPWELDDNPAIFIGVNVYDGLLRPTPDGMGLEPALATKYETTPDGLTWTFTLRDGVKFSDGTPLKAEDVKASLEATADLTKSGLSVWSANYSAIKEIQIPDAKTVKIILSQPYPALASALAMFFAGIVPADLAKASQVKDFKVADLFKTRGTGAYYCDGWQKGDVLVLKRNPNYWKGTPAVDEVRIEYVPDDNTRILKLQGGEVDVIDMVPLSQIAVLNTMPNITAKSFVVQALTMINFNVQKKPLDDVKIRQALNYATDKDAIIKAVYFGQAAFQNSPLPKGTYWDKDSPGYPYNLEKAKQLMAASSAPNGFTLEMQVRSGNTEYANIATIVKDEWAKIGVTVNILNLETSLVRTNYRNGSYMSMPFGNSNDMNDPSAMANAMMKGSGDTWAFWTHFDDPVLDANIEKSNVEMDPKKREALYKDIQKAFLDGAPQVFLVYKPDTAAWQKYVEGFAIEGLSYYRFEYVKINK